MRKSNPLHFSGIITTYACTASCAHCMYLSSSRVQKVFMSQPTADRIAELLWSVGTKSVHIGGGEPFLDLETLQVVLIALRKYGIHVDFIETNAYWCTDDAKTREVLSKVRALGVRCVMASVDPFHIEYVPIERPLRLARVLHDMRMECFIWQDRFVKRLLPLDPSRAHSKDALKALLGDDYAVSAAREYGLGINGRALQFAPALYNASPVDMLITSVPCDLLSRNHCHVDLFENVVPARCPGIAIELSDFLSGAVDEAKYPVAGRILNGGIARLFEYAKAHGFAEAEYPTKCALCVSMRMHLKAVKPSIDLAPDSFYTEMSRLS